MLSTPPRLRAAGGAVRRAVLALRRLIAALLAGFAVVAGLRATTAPPPATVAVTVAARDLPAGAVLGSDDLERAEYAPGTVPDGLAADPAGATLAAPVARGEPITGPRLVGPSLMASDPARQAVPVRFPDSGQVALLDPGDRIDVWAADPRGTREPRLVADAVVLAVPTAGEDGVADSLPGRLVLLGLPRDAVRDVTQHGVTSYLTYSFSG